VKSKPHGVTRRAFARLKCGAPRAALASARGPWPCSLAPRPLAGHTFSAASRFPRPLGDAAVRAVHYAGRLAGTDVVAEQAPRRTPWCSRVSVESSDLRVAVAAESRILSLQSTSSAQANCLTVTYACRKRRKSSFSNPFCCDSPRGYRRRGEHALRSVYLENGRYAAWQLGDGGLFGGRNAQRRSIQAVQDQQILSKGVR